MLSLGGRSKSLLPEVEEIRQASKRAGAIAGQLRAFAGLLACELRPVTLNQVIESLLPRLRGLFGRNIEIVADLIPELAPVRADPSLVRQIVFNLAANSQEALTSGGKFCVQTRNALSVEPGLGSGQVEGPYGKLAVGDNGPGMDNRSWEHLYERSLPPKRTTATWVLG